MVSKRQVYAVVIVIAIIIAGSSYLLFFNNSRNQTAAESMILKPGDLGAGWNEYSYSYTHEPFKNESCYSFCALYNDTFEVHIWLIVFNSSYDCEQEFQKENSSYLENENLFNYTIIQIGDRGFGFNTNFENNSYGYHGYPSIIFQKGNVLCNLWAYPSDYRPWMTDKLFDLAAIQLEKIIRNI
jgi:hypothetical protein